MPQPAASGGMNGADDHRTEAAANPRFPEPSRKGAVGRQDCVLQKGVRTMMNAPGTNTPGMIAPGTSTAPALLALSCLMAFTPTLARAEQPVTVQDSGCRVWDQYPDSRKTVRWSGACRNLWASGPGVLTWSYGGRYDGQVAGTFVEGRLEGHARVTWRDGRRFDGDFRRGRASGQGTHVWPDGRVYQGEWQDDRRTGFGTLRYPNGNRYVGTFHRNRPTGKGEFVTADGRRFQARIDARGNVSAGAPAARPPQSAAMPPAAKPPEPRPPEPGPPEPARPDPVPSAPEPSTKGPPLEEWLNEPMPMPRTDPH